MPHPVIHSNSVFTVNVVYSASRICCFGGRPGFTRPSLRLRIDSTCRLNRSSPSMIE